MDQRKQKEIASCILSDQNINKIFNFDQNKYDNAKKKTQVFFQNINKKDLDFAQINEIKKSSDCNVKNISPNISSLQK